MPDLIEALEQLHADLTAAGLVDDGAFADATVAGDLVLDETGRFVEIDLRARREQLPALPQRTSAVVASLLSGQPAYWFGGPRPRDREARAAMLALHERVLGDVRDPAVAAVLAFLRREPPQDHGVDLAKLPGFLIPRVGDDLVHTRPSVAAAWRAVYGGVEGNPRLRVISEHGLTRLVSANQPTAESYGRQPTLPPAALSGHYGAAANWLFARPSTVRIGETVVAAFVEGRPDLDPMPHLIPWREEYDPTPDWPGAVHLVAITARPPARLSVALHLVVDGAALAERLRVFHGALVSARIWRRARPLRTVWQAAFRGSARADAAALWVLEAVAEGRPLPRGALMEVLMLVRRSREDLDAQAALLTVLLGERSPPPRRKRQVERGPGSEAGAAVSIHAA